MTTDPVLQVTDLKKYFPIRVIIRRTVARFAVDSILDGNKEKPGFSRGIWLRQVNDCEQSQPSTRNVGKCSV